MSSLLLLCTFLIACDPLPPVPVPVLEVDQDEVGVPEQQRPVERDTGHTPITQNRAPVITTIEVEPGAPTTKDDIEVRVEAKDPDGDHVRFDYTWSVNNVEIRGIRAAVLPHTWYSKGDELKVRVLAKDREFETEGASPVIFVRNTPPEIVNKTGSLRSIDGYKVQALDVDSDDLTFRLEGEPEGMAIDGSTGILSYEGSQSAKAGSYQVNVIVEDSDKGSARWVFGINVAAGSGTDVAPKTQESEEGDQHSKRGWRPDQSDD